MLSLHCNYNLKLRNILCFGSTLCLVFISWSTLSMDVLNLLLLHLLVAIFVLVNPFVPCPCKILIHEHEFSYVCTIIQVGTAFYFYSLGISATGFSMEIQFNSMLRCAIKNECSNFIRMLGKYSI